MSTRLKGRFTSAHALAAAALFVALGGTAYALKANSVGSRQLKPNSVKQSEIASNAVITDKLADNAATGAKVNEATLGEVPSATSADSAGSADFATNASTAGTAQNAQSLGGETFQQVRPTAFGTSSTPVTPTSISQSGTTVLGPIDIDVPVGGADLVADAAVDVEEASTNDIDISCSLSATPGGTMGAPITVELFIDADGFVPTGTIPLSGIANHVQPDGGNVQVSVICSATGLGDGRFVAGSLTVIMVPDG